MKNNKPIKQPFAMTKKITTNPMNLLMNKLIKTGILSLLLMQVLPSYAVKYPIVGAGNCPGKWMEVSSGISGCIALYKSLYSGLLERNNYTFPARQFDTDRVRITNGEQYRHGFETHNIYGQYVGGTSITINECDVGFSWDITRGGCRDDVKVGCQNSDHGAGNSQSGNDPNANGPGTSEGNPCSAATGNKFQTEMDYNSRFLPFIRYYNSLTPITIGLGSQWSHNYSARLSIDMANNTIAAFRVNGQTNVFRYVNGSWQGNDNMTLRLIQNGAHWQLITTSDTIETYNELGQLTTITTRDGQSTQLTYLNDRLERVSDPYGHELLFTYDSDNRLKTVTTPELNPIIYDYNASNMLATVTYPDNSPETLDDNPKKTYHYEIPALYSFLTGITNENGVRYATWDYNSDGKAILSEHAGGAEKVQLVYNSASQTTVTDALGRVKTYTFGTFFGFKKPLSITMQYHDGQTLINKTQFYTYNSRGFLATKTDYNGIVTRYAYNDRGLVTSLTEAEGTPEERLITTTWHPNFRLPATRTYPDRTETYSYDTQGRLMTTQLSSNP